MTDTSSSLCSPPPDPDLSLHRRNRRHSKRRRWRPSRKRLNVIVHDHVGQHHLQLLLDEEATRAENKVSQKLRYEEEVEVQGTYQACRPWPKGKKFSLVLVKLVFCNFKNSAFFSSPTLPAFVAWKASLGLENRKASYWFGSG